tara:strand:+ start:750 stop:1757 length:1008 start_codon:yes stop_codon:yes gene_type:complete
MNKIALITGINGQDGAYLSEFLLKKKYKIIGIDKNINRNYWRLKKLKIYNKIIFKKIDITNSKQIKEIFSKYKIHEVYNLAALSSVQNSFSNPLKAANIGGLSVLKILEIIRKNKNNIKFYQASSSEMFGNLNSKSQSENSNFNPQSPYGISKLFGHYVTINYRKSYNIYAVSGILFNHESPLRGEEFVTKKIIRGLIDIKKRKKKFIELGNIYTKRDWGFAKEYVEQMWKMLNQKIPRDFVIASGKTYSIKDFVNEVTKNLKMKTKWKGTGFNEKLYLESNNKIIIKINKKLFRPSEVNYVRGNIAKAKKYLNWKPKITFKKLIKIMVEEELKS